MTTISHEAHVLAERDLSREPFEAWFKSDGLVHAGCSLNRSHDLYDDPITQALWVGWAGSSSTVAATYQRFMDEIAAQSSRIVGLEAELEKCGEAIELIIGCFDAAFAEGLAERLIELHDDGPGSVLDIWNRRIAYAGEYARTISSETKGEVDVCPVNNLAEAVRHITWLRGQIVGSLNYGDAAGPLETCGACETVAREPGKPAHHMDFCQIPAIDQFLSRLRAASTSVKS